MAMTLPLVLLHAYPLDARLFDDIRDLLHPVITPCQRGFGGRELGTDPPSLKVLADDVIAELDAQGISQAIIGGVSMGGYVALSLLRRHRHRLAGLILIDTKAHADDMTSLHHRLHLAAAADTGDIPDGMRAITPLVAANCPQPVRTRLAAIAAAQPAATIAWAQRAMAARPDSTAALAAADLPVQVIVGEYDALTPVAVARQMAQSCAGELVVVPDAGHLTPLEAPQATAAAITAFRERLSGPSARTSARY